MIFFAFSFESNYLDAEKLMEKESSSLKELENLG